MKNFLMLLCLLLFNSHVQAQQGMETQHVFLITLDGLRWQELFTGADKDLIFSDKYVPAGAPLLQKYWHEDPLERRKMLMPFIWSTLATEGRLMGNRLWGNKVNLTNETWYSYPGYNELLTGVNDPALTKNRKIKNHHKTVLEFVNEQPGFSGKVAAFGSWSYFPYIINEERSGIPVNAGYEPVTGAELTEKEKVMNGLLTHMHRKWPQVRPDVFTHQYALEYIKRNKPRLIHIAYGETDDYAHAGRYDQYLEAASQTDAYIRELWEYVQSQEQYRGKTTFIIATDHGRGNRSKRAWRRHGNRTPGADEVWVAMIGPDTPAVGELKTSGQFYQHQIAATVAFFLGLHFDPSREANTKNAAYSAP